MSCEERRGWLRSKRKENVTASTLMGMNERMWLSTSRASSCLHGMHLTQRQENGQPTILINSKMDKSYLIGPPLCGFTMNPPFVTLGPGRDKRRLES